MFAKLEEERYEREIAAKGGKRHNRGPIVRADKRIDISNYINFQYTGPVFMGDYAKKCRRRLPSHSKHPERLQEKRGPY